jgi:hypothetical protein
VFTVIMKLMKKKDVGELTEMAHVVSEGQQ